MKLTMGQKIRIGRIKQNLKQAELAEKIGIAKNNLCKIERDEIKNPRGSTLIALATVLDVSLDYLVGRKDEESDSELATVGGSH